MVAETSAAPEATDAPTTTREVMILENCAASRAIFHAW